MALLVTARQGITLREAVSGELKLSPALAGMHADLAARVPLVVEDRALDVELRELLAAVRAEAWSLYADA